MTESETPQYDRIARVRREVERLDPDTRAWLCVRLAIEARDFGGALELLCELATGELPGVMVELLARQAAVTAAACEEPEEAHLEELASALEASAAQASRAYLARVEGEQEDYLREIREAQRE